MTRTTAKILVIEDDELTIDMLQMVLGMSGHQVVPALTIESGLQLATAEKFDVFLLDSYLPDGTGQEACVQIREFDQRTPIIFCSGDASGNARLNALGAGAQIYLTKPVDTEVLEELVMNFLRRPLD